MSTEDFDKMVVPLLSGGCEVWGFVDLTFPKQALVCTFLRYKSFENTVGKREIARNEQFLLSPQCFPPFGKLSAIFIKFEFVVCRLFQYGRV